MNLEASCSQAVRRQDNGMAFSQIHLLLLNSLNILSTLSILSIFSHLSHFSQFPLISQLVPGSSSGSSSGLPLKKPPWQWLLAARLKGTVVKICQHLKNPGKRNRGNNGDDKILFTEKKKKNGMSLIGRSIGKLIGIRSTEKGTIGTKK